MKLPFKVDKGCLHPAAQYVIDELRRRKYKIGDVVFCVITKPRNPQFNRLVHAFGKLVSENIESFSKYDAHSVLKRLQIESGLGCEDARIKVGDYEADYRIPKSLSFESMKEDEFKDLFLGFCRFISEKYWPSESPERVYELAQIMAHE